MPIRDTLRRFLGHKTPAPPSPSPSKSPPEASDPPVSSGAHELVLYKYDSCPYCRRVQRVISELGLTDQIEMRDTRREPRWRADLVEKIGRTQVPCLFIDGEPMFESADISDWLRENYA
jgi:glutaredoxin 3